MKIRNPKHEIRILLICILFTFILCGNIFADTLYLKNGTQIKGKTVKQDAEKVVFRIGEEEDTIDVTFFSDEILRIDKQELSNFLTLPFGKGKQVFIPRPVLSQQPIIGEKKENLKEGNRSEAIEGKKIKEEDSKNQEDVVNESVKELEKILEQKKNRKSAEEEPQKRED